MSSLVSTYVFDWHDFAAPCILIPYYACLSDQDWERALCICVSLFIQILLLIFYNKQWKYKFMQAKSTLMLFVEGSMMFILCQDLQGTSTSRDFMLQGSYCYVPILMTMTCAIVKADEKQKNSLSMALSLIWSVSHQ